MPAKISLAWYFSHGLIDWTGKKLRLGEAGRQLFHNWTLRRRRQPRGNSLRLVVIAQAISHRG